METIHFSRNQKGERKKGSRKEDILFMKTIDFSGRNSFLWKPFLMVKTMRFSGNIPLRDHSLIDFVTK